jgi:ParB/RepB/Spo0J family partition protein
VDKTNIPDSDKLSHAAAPGEMREIRTNVLKPNDYNPNRMTAEEFAELVEEVRHLGRLPKPVIVRNGYASGEYVIVDGEHGWRAAKEAGLAEVTCEVIEADDFEAMRQTYKRNQHGTHDRAALGKMFRRMMGERGISNRQLAKEINVSEGTIRNALTFAEAAELRMRCYGEPGATEVDYAFLGLTTKQARLYVALPEIIRDKWVDEGMPDDWGLPEGGRFEYEPDLLRYVSQLEEAGISKLFERGEWAERARQAHELLQWRNKHLRLAENIDEYIRPVIEMHPRKPSVTDIIDELPFHNGKLLLSPEEWASAVRVAWDKGENVWGMLGRITDVAKLKAAEKGIPEEDLDDPRVALMKLEVERDAPDFIRDADLPLRAKEYFLKRADYYRDGRAGVDASRLSEEERLRCKRAAVNILEREYRRHRTEFEEFRKAVKAYDKRLDELPPDQAMRLIMGGAGPKHPKPVPRTEDAWKAAIKALYDEEEDTQKRASRAQLKELFEDSDKVADAIAERFKTAAPKIFEQGLGDMRAWEVLRERLKKVPEPEMLLLGAVMLKAPVTVWLDAVREEVEGRGDGEKRA